MMVILATGGALEWGLKCGLCSWSLAIGSPSCLMLGGARFRGLGGQTVDVESMYRQQRVFSNSLNFEDAQTWVLRIHVHTRGLRP